MHFNNFNKCMENKMGSPIPNFDEKLAELQQEIIELESKLERNNSARENLKAHVNSYEDLGVQRKEIKKTLRDLKSKLNTILDFIKESTGEDTYSIFPLFAQANSNENATVN